jgi:hypothetical protein
MPPDGTPSANHLIDFLAGRLADTETGWSLGTFGAIASRRQRAGGTSSDLRDARQQRGAVYALIRHPSCASLRRNR